MSEEDLKPEEPAEAVAPQCPTCRAPRLGDFCQDCGQRHPQGRLTFGGLVRELPARFFNVDRGFLRTFLELMKRPGVVSKAYVGGRRSLYINPLTYFLIAATVQLLALTLTQGLMIQHIEEQMSRDPQTVERFEKALGENPTQKLAKIYVSVLKQGYTYLFLFFMSVPFAVYLRLLARRLEPSYNFAELLVFSIFTSAHMVLVTGLLLPFSSRISPFLHMALSLSIYLLIGLLAAKDFFAGGFKRYVVVLAAEAAAMLTFFFSLTTIFLVIMILNSGASSSGT